MTRTQYGQATPSVVVIVSVVAVVAALVAFFAGGDGDPRAVEAQANAGAAGTPSASPSAKPSPSPSSEPSPRERRTKEARGEKTQAEKTQAEKSKRDRAEARKRQRPEPDPARGAPDVYIEVYNNTAITGLAASTAAQLQDGGWQVVGVDNWHGSIPASTVYYPDGLYDEAQQLAQTLGVGRTHGAVAPMKFDRLTVILTPDAA